MALETYSQLKSAIAEWLDVRTNQALVSRIPDFIAMAERRLQRRLTPWWLERVATITESGGDGVVPTPDRVQQVRLLTTSSGAEIEYRTPMALAALPENNTPGTPEYYTVVDCQIQTYPKLAEGLSLKAVYIAYPEPLSDTNPTNSWLSYAPDALLFATLVQAIPYLRDDERAPLWERYFQGALEEIEMQDKNRRWGGSPLRIVSDASFL